MVGGYFVATTADKGLSIDYVKAFYELGPDLCSQLCINKSGIFVS